MISLHFSAFSNCCDNYIVVLFIFITELHLICLIWTKKWPQLNKVWKFMWFKPGGLRTSLVVQWQRLHAPRTGDPGSIPGQGTRSPVLQRSRMHQRRSEIQCTTTETEHSQINRKKPQTTGGQNDLGKYKEKNGHPLSGFVLYHFPFWISWSFQTCIPVTEKGPCLVLESKMRILMNIFHRTY